MLGMQSLGLNKPQPIDCTRAAVVGHNIHNLSIGLSQNSEGGTPVPVQRSETRTAVAVVCPHIEDGMCAFPDLEGPNNQDGSEISNRLAEAFRNVRVTNVDTKHNFISIEARFPNGRILTAELFCQLAGERSFDKVDIDKDSKGRFTETLIAITLNEEGHTQDDISHQLEYLFDHINDSEICNLISAGYIRNIRMTCPWKSPAYISKK